MLKIIDAHDIFEADKKQDVYLSWVNKHGDRVFTRMKDIRLEVIYERQEDASTIWFIVEAESNGET